MRRSVALGALAGFVVALGLALALSSRDRGAVPLGSLAAALEVAVPALPPFSGLTATHVAVGDDCLSVVIADERSERVEGLRAKTTVAPYDGMLFVLDNETIGRFTMADTLIPLDIGFYGPDGGYAGELAMQPCPPQAVSCPSYESESPVLVALEVPAGELPLGSLAACG